MTRPPNPRFQLELECLPRPGLDPDRRLARLLKCALRSFGFRCRHVALVRDQSTATREEPGE